MEMTLETMREQIAEKLKAEGYGGLYYPGECACGIDDLMPCGSCEKEEDEDYVNGCESGYKHVDPNDPGFFVISAHKDDPKESWEDLRARYL